MIKNKTKFALLTLSLLWYKLNHVLQADFIDISDDNFFCPYRVASKARLTYDGEKKEFIAFLDGNEQKINQYNISEFPLNLSEVQVKNLLSIAHFSLGDVGNEYSLTVNLRLKEGMKKATNNVEGLKKLEKEYEEISLFISKHPQGACVKQKTSITLGYEEDYLSYGRRSYYNSYGRCLEGHKIYETSITYTSYCVEKDCQLSEKVARLQHLKQILEIK